MDLPRQPCETEGIIGTQEQTTGKLYCSAGINRELGKLSGNCLCAQIYLYVPVSTSSQSAMIKFSAI